MTRERVEQAIERVRTALQVSLDLWKDDNEPGDFDRDVIEPLQRGLVSLTTLSNALAESEKERERLRGALLDAHKTFVRIAEGTAGEGNHQAARLGAQRTDQALYSPDSQEKRDG